MQSLPVEIFHHIFLFIGMRKCHSQRIYDVSRSFKYYWTNAIVVQINNRKHMNVLFDLIDCEKCECPTCYLGKIYYSEYKCIQCWKRKCNCCRLRCACGYNTICKNCKLIRTCTICKTLLCHSGIPDDICNVQVKYGEHPTLPKLVICRSCYDKNKAFCEECSDYYYKADGIIKCPYHD